MAIYPGHEGTGRVFLMVWADSEQEEIGDVFQQEHS